MKKILILIVFILNVNNNALAMNFWDDNTVLKGSNEPNVALQELIESWTRLLYVTWNITEAFCFGTFSKFIMYSLLGE